MNHDREVLECAICLQICVYPTQLPCDHIFCFLCIKGLANQIKKCAMCRREIPHDFLENPKLLENEDRRSGLSDASDSEYQWFYEGRNGWWKYDIRTNRELEEAFGGDSKNCELLIAGYVYVVDFESMLQIRKNDSSRRRKIKRNAIECPIKGTAGIRCLRSDTRNKTSEVDGVRDDGERVQSDDGTRESDDSLESAIDRLSSMNLDDI